MHSMVLINGGHFVPMNISAHFKVWGREEEELDFLVPERSGPMGDLWGIFWRSYLRPREG